MDICGSCPNLEDLTLGYNYVAKSSILLPPLRPLTLKRVAVGCRANWVAGYGKLLTKYEKMGFFNRLTFSHCGIYDVNDPEPEDRRNDMLPDFNGKLVVI